MGELDAPLAYAARALAVGGELEDHRLQSHAAWNRAWYSATRWNGDETIAWATAASSCHRIRSITRSPSAGLATHTWSAAMRSARPGSRGSPSTCSPGWATRVSSAGSRAGSPRPTCSRATPHRRRPRRCTGRGVAAKLASRGRRPGPTGAGQHRRAGGDQGETERRLGEGAADLRGDRIALRRRAHPTSRWPSSRTRRAKPAAPPSTSTRPAGWSRSSASRATSPAPSSSAPATAKARTARRVATPVR
jgi:hypothetical protein